MNIRCAQFAINFVRNQGKFSIIWVYNWIQIENVRHFVTKVGRIWTLERYFYIQNFQVCENVMNENCGRKNHIGKLLTLTRPLRRKLRMRFFDVSKVKESSSFKSDLTDPPSDFWCASFGKYKFNGFIAYTNEWDWRDKNDVYSHLPTFNHFILYKKIPIFCLIRDESALIRNFVRHGRVTG